jgi:hypothetical protein
MGGGTGMSDGTATGGLGPFDPYWTDEAPCGRRGRPGWGRRVALGLAAGVGLVGVASLGSAPTSAPSPVSAIAATPPSGEVLDPNLAPLFALETREGAQARYEARIDRASGDRRDDLSLGALEGDGPTLRVEMWKGGGARAAGSLFVEMAEESAEFGAAVERLEGSRRLTSSQGPVEWAELTLAEGRAQRRCAGFRLPPRADGGLRGIACAAAGGKIEAEDLNCLFDRLALTRAGREAGFGDIVRSGGPRRATCRAAIG